MGQKRAPLGLNQGDMGREKKNNINNEDDMLLNSQ
jgi:hypothetical protein